MKKNLAQILIGQPINRKNNYIHNQNYFLNTIREKKAYAIAISIRESIIKMLLSAGSGHTAGALGMAEVFVALYFFVLKHNPLKPNWENRDRLILSNGHICPVLYATLSKVGYFPATQLATLRKFNSKLQGHPHLNKNLGIENTSGPLGQGLSQAIGMALGFKLDQRNNRVYCVMGDGEQQEGQNWEAYMYAGNRKLNNLTVLIDRNNIQIDGYTKDVMPLKPLTLKLESFNWNVLSINGHNIEAIISACHQAQITQEKPTAIICNTTPGKGVSFMENLPEWHGKAPNKQEAEMALRELKKLKDQL